MRKKLALALLVGSGITFSSCAQEKKENSDLEILLTSTNAEVTPGPTQTCKAFRTSLASGVYTNDVGEDTYFASFGQPTLEWNNGDKLFIFSRMTMTFSHSQLGGKFTCQVSTDEVDALFTGSTGSQYDAGVLPAATSGGPSVATPYKSPNRSCRLICTGFPIDEENEDEELRTRTFTALGTITVRGRAAKEDGSDEEAVVAKKEVEVNFTSITD